MARPTCRELVKLKNIKTGVIVFADTFATWEDLGNGYLQPTSSRQTQPEISPTKLKVGQGYNGWVLASDRYYYLNTSMNNYSFIRPL